MLPFTPQELGYFLRPEKIYPGDIKVYELDHIDIDKSILKDWKRINVYLSQDGDYITIWTGPIDLIAASFVYEKEYGFELSTEQHVEYYFRGYIRTREEGRIIWNALHLKNFRPYYLGESDPWLKHHQKN